MISCPSDLCEHGLLGVVADVEVFVCVLENMSDKPVCVADFELHAQRVLPKAVFDYYVSGSDEQETLSDNVAAFSRYVTVPSVMSSLKLSVLLTPLSDSRHLKYQWQV